MILSEISVRRPVFAMVVSLLLAIIGLMAASRLTVRETPDVQPPIVSIDTQYRGASASVVESRITQIIEDRIAGLEGIDTLRSSSLDGRSDVYSLGCVLYELLAGEPPYTGITSQAVMIKRFVDPVPQIRRLRPSVPASVEQAITKALAVASADRFATAAEFADALTRQLEKADRTASIASSICLASLWRACDPTTASSPSRLGKCRYAALGDTPIRRAVSRSTTPSGPWAAASSVAASTRALRRSPW